MILSRSLHFPMKRKNLLESLELLHATNLALAREGGIDKMQTNRLQQASYFQSVILLLFIVSIPYNNVCCLVRVALHSTRSSSLELTSTRSRTLLDELHCREHAVGRWVTTSNISFGTLHTRHVISHVMRSSCDFRFSRLVPPSLTRPPVLWIPRQSKTFQ